MTYPSVAFAKTTFFAVGLRRKIIPPVDLNAVIIAPCLHLMFATDCLSSLKKVKKILSRLHHWRG
jgi:hypothetical protein